ncbi:FIG00822893: hypothetical protein [hydrothermal vent metagenome]|uniref:Cytoplasmic protein clustered with trehalase n=1 Tax=hydrothermal vent metagenome TaxID=652676 RepID=A0A3B0TB09_9ZZZZ
MATISPDRARRIALGSQGFAKARPAGNVTERHFRSVVSRLGLIQLDSVNVAVRSHYMPFFARLGAYDRERLDRWLATEGEMAEYWGHEASAMPVELIPYLRWRMEDMHPWGIVRKAADHDPDLIDRVHREVAELGPLRVSDIAEGNDRTGPWWGLGKAKIALEWLLACGRVTAWRDHRFARVYDITERRIPAAVLSHSVDRHEAHRHLLLQSAQHHGIGTANDLIDYYRLNKPRSRPILEELAGEGLLDRVEVPGWNDPAYMHPAAVTPRTIRGATLLSPFDPLVWERARTERIFGMRYRIEIYVPKERREFGYYSLPFLVDGELVARVDLKADRRASVLMVQSAHLQQGQNLDRVASALANHLEEMASWLGMETISVTEWGDLTGPLARLLS